MKQQISVTGILIPDSQHPSGSQKGFTLIEIIVVVAIMGIVVTMMVLSSSFNQGEQALDKLGKQISKNIQLLSQEAVFENRNFAISLNPDGAQILLYNGEDWVLFEDAYYQKIKFRKEIFSDLRIEKKAIKPVKADKLIAHIMIFSSGEMTPFSWHIEDENTQTEIRLDGSLLGKVVMIGPVSQL